ncbi:helix-turn-helix domain-containing protein [Bradyrhizobium sp. CCBAU 51745]|uniref:helix-turn-helix domain-containing protein n=1 Tax=Bradyrhizobium sp. CCBAU 51745 TaxID=1325099 RepID=UPI0023067B28|nr:helix-turn-helix transcriptional regulator [Bradyrhizobium sp. CCBAU 51745]
MRRRKPAHTRRLLARNIRRLRLQRDWSQDDLADAAGMRQALVSPLEVSTANPTLETLDKVAIALDVEVADLLMPIAKVFTGPSRRRPPPARSRGRSVAKA